MTFTGAQNANDYEVLSRHIAGNTNLSYLDVFYPFEDFVETGNGATWANLGELVFGIDGTQNADLDVSIDLIETNDGVRDYGDLPDTSEGPPDYTTGIDGNKLSAYHSNPQGLTLGYNVDTEDTYNASSDARGDDDQNSRGEDDEDGVQPHFNRYNEWKASVTVNGCEEQTCYLSGWIDWNSDGDFADSGEQFINDDSGDQDYLTFDYPLNPPVGHPNGYYYLRFRICDEENECNQPTGVATNGEVEDYRWYMDTTAVELLAFEAVWQVDAVDVTWETTLEQDTVGFNVLRSTAEDGDYVQLNDELIPSQSPGSTLGGSYVFSDEDVTSGTRYYYKLEELEVGGAHIWYGPTSTGVEMGAISEGETTELTLASFAARTAGVAGWPAAAVFVLAGGLLGLVRKRRRR